MERGTLYVRIRMRIIRYARAPSTTSWRGLRKRLAKLNLAKILPQYKGRAIGKNFIPRIFGHIGYIKKTERAAMLICITTGR